MFDTPGERRFPGMKLSPLLSAVTLSLRKLAELSGLSYGTLRLWSGTAKEVEPEPESLVKLADGIKHFRKVLLRHERSLRREAARRSR